MFKIHSILLTNNESDILAECLEAACRWADHIYVFDTGSTDNTWEIIRGMAAAYPQIVPYRSEYRPYNFTKTLGEVFAHYFENSAIGDWWCTLCTDEQYPEDPRMFLAKVNGRYNCVWSSTLNYYFSEVEMKNVEEDARWRTGDLRGIKYSEFLCHYLNNYSEVRFYRHNAATRADTSLQARNFQGISPQRIAMQHFQYRSPKQIVDRVRSRQRIFDGDPLFQFAHEVDFRLDQNGVPRVSVKEALAKGVHEMTDAEILATRVISSSRLNVDRKDGKFVFDESRLPPIQIQLTELFSEVAAQVRLRIKGQFNRISNYRLARSVVAGQSLSPPAAERRQSITVDSHEPR